MGKRLNRKLTIGLFRAAIVLVFFIFVARLWHFQIVQGAVYRIKADRNRYRLVNIEAPRGVIYDRNYNVLARNRPAFTVGIVPADLPEDETEREQVYALLSRLLGIPASIKQEELAQTAKGGVLSLADPTVASQPPRGIQEMVEAEEHNIYELVPIKTNVDREVAFFIEEEHLNLPGVQVKLEPIRQYLNGPLAAHVLGYVGHIPAETVEEYVAQGYNQNDQVGLTGVELTFESELRGISGRKHVEVDVAGREVRTVGKPEPALAGHNLALTIDLDLQRAMESALQRAMDLSGAESGVTIAMNPHSGEILGLVSLPTYDNNLFASGITIEEYRRLSSDPNHPLVNHAIGGQYPPGSTFKVIPAAAIIQEGVVRPDTIFWCEGMLWLPNKLFPDNPDLAQGFRCWAEEGHKRVNFLSAIAQSCDIYFYQVTGGYGDFEGLGLERLVQYARLFGLGEPTGIDLPGESAGLVPTSKWKRLTYSESWFTGDTYNMAIGQGFVLATPLQMLNVAAVMANGGTLYRPQLVHQVIDAEGRILRTVQPEVIRRLPLPEDTLNLVRQGMRIAVTSGTAQLANLPHVSVAGKTGTAEFPGPRDREGNLPTHAWFIAFAPFEDPKIALVVFVAGGGEGSEIAVPVAAEILSHYFPPPEEAAPESTAPIPTPQPAAPPPPLPAAPDDGGQQGSLRARLVSVTEIPNEISQLVGTVIDAQGQGIPGVQLTINGGGAPVFEPVTGPDGTFGYNFLNAYASARWNIRIVGRPDAEELYLEVEPFKRYTVQFYEAGP